MLLAILLMQNFLMSVVTGQANQAADDQRNHSYFYDNFDDDLKDYSENSDNPYKSNIYKDQRNNMNIYGRVKYRNSRTSQGLHTYSLLKLKSDLENIFGNRDVDSMESPDGGQLVNISTFQKIAGGDVNITSIVTSSNTSEGDVYEDEEMNNCTNEYCISDDEYYDMIVQHILPSKSEWLLIAMHCMVFFVGLIGNALVCIAVYRNRSMRTVTNYFIVNLAVADFMVILFCLPPTLIWDVTQTWFMGTLCCKVVLYFQTVSVAVSVLTLTFISVDRWYAICFPLKFKSTTGRAKTAIIVIWLLAIGFDIPELLVLETRKFHKFQNMDLVFFTQCSATWSEGHEEMFQLARILLLYTVPLFFMSIAYCQIVRVLWKSDNIPGHSETLVLHSASGLGRSGRIVNNTTECQLRSRRKAAKMLVAVVLMFAVCYFPVHLLNILRMTMDIKQTEVTGSLAIVSHWLCYANSAVNPVIYNFMSGKFRKEFHRAFGNMCLGKKSQQRKRNRADSTMVCRYTTMTVGSVTTPRTEIVHMSNATTVIDMECPDAILSRAIKAQNRDRDEARSKSVSRSSTILDVD